jgi:hypothetical protein
MKRAQALLTLLILAELAVTAADVPPPWAYGFTAPAMPGAAPRGPGGGGCGGRGGGGGGPGAQADPTPLRLEGSTLEFTRTQVNDGFGPADWFPGDLSLSAIWS